MKWRRRKCPGGFMYETRGDNWDISIGPAFGGFSAGWTVTIEGVPYDGHADFPRLKVAKAATLAVVEILGGT